MRTCSTIACRSRRKSETRKVVWMLNGKPFCNCCFLDWLDGNEIAKNKIVRLFNDEGLYEDTRRTKRRGKQQRIRPAATHAAQA